MNKKRKIGFGTTEDTKTKSRPKVPQPDSIEFKTTATINIMPTLKDQIDYLHQMISNREWSGILFYEILEGSMEDPDKLVLNCHYLMPLNIGSSVYTEYDPDEATLDAFDMFEGAEDMERATIHTHHNMRAFFSTTDTEDLLEKVADESHSYYLSLIVNIHEEYKAKIALMSKENFTEYTVHIGGQEHPVRVTNKKKTAVVYQIESIILPPGKEMDRPFREQVDKIIEAAKPKTTTITSRTWDNGYSAWNEEFYGGNLGKASYIPGTNEKLQKNKEDEKAEKVKLDFSKPNFELEVFSSILTVGFEYGTLPETYQCGSVQQLITLVYETIEDYAGPEDMKKFIGDYHRELKENLVTVLLLENNKLTVHELRNTIEDIRAVLNTIPLIPDETIEKFLTSIRIVLTNMKHDALSELRLYRKQFKHLKEWKK